MALGNMAVVMPAHPSVVKPLIVSNLGEGNLIYRVQPIYPPLAQPGAHSGHGRIAGDRQQGGDDRESGRGQRTPNAGRAALEAVRQWRYRPYLLNGDPIEVETDITVNFVLSGN